MKVVANKIYYKDHVVICDPDCASADYMEMMSASLTEEGGMGDHREELRRMNNDGTWTFKKVSKKVCAAVLGV